jgi:hypothetical protein
LETGERTRKITNYELRITELQTHNGKRTSGEEAEEASSREKGRGRGRGRKLKRAGSRKIG